MLFSVVIPLFNKEKYIKRTVESVLHQVYDDFELLVIDDGSTDGSADVVRAFSDTRIRLIYQDNCGETCARNRGIKEAADNYIAFLDADDAWDPNFLLNIKQLIDKYPQAGAFGTAYDIVDSNGVKSKVRLSGLPGGEGWSGILPDYFECLHGGESPLHSSSICIAKGTFESVGFFTDGIKIGGDIDMWVRVALRVPVAYMNEANSTHFRDVAGRVSDSYFVGEPPLSYEKTLLTALENKEVDTRKANSIIGFLAKFNYLNAVNSLRFGEIKASKLWLSRVKPQNWEMRIKRWVLLILSYFPASIASKVVKYRESL